MNMNTYYAVDVGGTSVKCGVVTQGGAVLGERSFPTQSFSSFFDFADYTYMTLRSISDILSTSPIGIGISVPGFPDRNSGKLIGAGNENIKIFKDYSLQQMLSSKFVLPASIENDGVCAALAELRYGVGSVRKNFIMMTLGTGIGGAVVSGGRVMKADSGIPPEFGGIKITCESGPTQYGSLESLAGGKHVIKRYADTVGEDIKSITVNVIRQRAVDGEKKAVQAMHELGRYIAHGLGTIINVTGVTTCVLGGGISLSGKYLTDIVEKEIVNFAWKSFHEHIQVVASVNGNHNGMIGAVENYKTSIALT